MRNLSEFLKKRGYRRIESFVEQKILLNFLLAVFDMNF